MAIIDVNIMVKKKINVNKPLTDDEVEIIVRELQLTKTTIRALGSPKALKNKLLANTTFKLNLSLYQKVKFI